MLREDSNGETFEVIDKRTSEEASSNDRALSESMSSISSSISLVTSPAVPTGNLFSNVAPPSALPSFVPTIVATSTIVNVNESSDLKRPPNLHTHTEAASHSQQSSLAEPYYPTQFSAAIPPSKGIQHGPISLPDTPHALSSEPSFMGWMKGAVGASGGIFSKVAERARNSVESMITTLDPQMREYIYSGGDISILIASSQEVKVSPIQEAFQNVFGKAVVRGMAAQATNIAAQPVGFAAGIKAAEERIQAIFNNPNIPPTPVIAVENFLLEVGEDKWYDLGVILLHDPIKQITFQTFTQMTPIPTPIVTLAQDDTPADYPLKWSGYSVTIGSLMAKNLGVSHTEWHHALTGVTRRDMILLAAKALAALYKTALIPT